MTDNQLSSVISAYAAGLDAELSLLHRLQDLARRHHQATVDDDARLRAEIGDERARTLASLVELEHQIKPLRQDLASSLDRALAIPGFAHVVALHRDARRLVASILASDRDTMQSLHEAEVARRLSAQTIEAGATTLAAYRRVVAPPTRNAIVDTKG